MHTHMDLSLYHYITDICPMKPSCKQQKQYKPHFL